MRRGSRTAPVVMTTPCRKIESRTVEYQTITAEYGKPIPTEEMVYSASMGTCQLAGTGEILNSASLVLLRNLVDPDPAEVRKIDLVACEWIRKRCMDDDFACYLNPLNRLRFKDSKWTYSKDKIDQYYNPDNPKEFGWRRWNALFIAPIFYLLSLFDDTILERQKRDTYLLWAYGVLKWYYSTDPTFVGFLANYNLKVMAELERRGYGGEAKKLREGHLAAIRRLKAAAEEIDGKDFVRDELGLEATALLLEKDLDSALPFLRVNDTGLGYSYDPRIQSSFRFWDDGASGGYYQLVPYPTMPHFLTSFAGYSNFLAYELTGNEQQLVAAYNSIMTFYEYYNHDYKWNKWGKLRKGQAHANYLPGLDMSTQERHCVDQDMSMLAYMETFGTKCFITRSGRNVNCQDEGEEVKSWAMYPREYYLDNENIVVRTSHPATVISRILREKPGLAIDLENLTESLVKTVITVRTGASIKTSEVELAGHERLAVSTPNV